MKPEELITYFCNDEYIEDEFVAVLGQHVKNTDKAMAALAEEGYIKKEGNKILVLKH